MSLDARRFATSLRNLSDCELQAAYNDQAYERSERALLIKGEASQRFFELQTK